MVIRCLLLRMMNSTRNMMQWETSVKMRIGMKPVLIGLLMLVVVVVVWQRWSGVTLVVWRLRRVETVIANQLQSPLVLGERFVDDSGSLEVSIGGVGEVIIGVVRRRWRPARVRGERWRRAKGEV